VAYELIVLRDYQGQGTDLTYVDVDVPDGTYRYRVTTIDGVTESVELVETVTVPFPPASNIAIGTVATTLGGFSGNSSGTATSTTIAAIGTVLAALGGFALGSSGSAIGNQEGITSATLGGFGVSSSGNATGTVNGAVATTLGGFSTSSTGSALGTVNGVTTASLGGFTVVSSGDAEGTNIGTVSITIGGFTVTSSGDATGADIGTLATILGGFSVSAGGEAQGTDIGTSTVSLGGLTVGALGEAQTPSAAAQAMLVATLGGFATSSSGFAYGTVDTIVSQVILGGFSVSGNGNVAGESAAVVTSTLGGFSVSGAGVVPVTQGTVTAALGGFTLSGNGEGIAKVSGTTSITLGGFSVVAGVAESNTHSGGSCGTGKGTLVIPGDPDLNSSALTAVSAKDYIALSWTLPTINVGALSKVLIYRNTVNNFDTAALIRTWAGDYFQDRVDVQLGTTYYYWIRLLSVNSTLGDPIGPASATMQPPIAWLIEAMEGQLSNSVLNTTLRSQIDSINTITSDLAFEVSSRLSNETGFSDMVADLISSLGDTDALLASEVTARQDGNAAVIEQLDLMIAQGGGGDSAAAIAQEASLRVAEDIALGVLIASVTTTAGNNLAAHTNYVAAQVTAETARVERFETIEAQAGDDVAALEALAVVVSGPDGLTAQWQVKTDINGYISGFGLYSDGATSDFLVLADTFAIGSPTYPDVFPFIIADVNGETQIALNARTLIPDAHITNAMIEGVIQSNNYNYATGSGWKIDKAGEAIFGAITIVDSNGDIVMTSGTSDALRLAGTTIRDSSGNIIVQSDGAAGDSFQSTLAWDFANSDVVFGQGWTSSAANHYRYFNTLNHDVSAPDPQMISPQVFDESTPPVQVNTWDGEDNPIIQVRIKRSEGTGWQGVCYYRTASHNYSYLYHKAVPEPVGIDDEFVVVEFDMHDLTLGGTDYKDNVITQIRFDWGVDVPDRFFVDWIRIGRRSGSGNGGRHDSSNLQNLIAPQAIDNTYIKNLSVDSLQIKGRAVTLPEYYKDTTERTLTGWVNVCELNNLVISETGGGAGSAAILINWHALVEAETSNPGYISINLLGREASGGVWTTRTVGLFGVITPSPYDLEYYRMYNTANTLAGSFMFYGDPGKTYEFALMLSTDHSRKCFQAAIYTMAALK